MSIKIYLVGGAVRDELLGNKVSDLDYVVVGSNPETMIANGFEQVGKDFPVFLDPLHKDEHALARTERKSGEGYGGFDCEWEGVSLEEDLSRRDLTVNALAKDSHGNVIDYHNGVADLENKILRHVSDAFAEDPVRILRIARFMAKMPEFTIAPETHEMIVDMVDRGMINELTPERVWKEMHRAIESSHPSRFFETLKSFGALEIILPVVHDMIGVPQRADYHAEGDVFIHTMMVLDEAVELTKHLSDEDKLTVRMGALLHDVGKTTTPHDVLYYPDGSMRGSHTNHDSKHRVDPLIDEIFDKYLLPDQLRRFCKDVGVFHQRIHGCKALKKSSGFYKIFDKMNIKNKADGRGADVYLRNLLLTCKADAFGRCITNELGEVEPAKRSYPQAEIMTEKFAQYNQGLKYLGEFLKTAFSKGLKAGADINIETTKRDVIMLGFKSHYEFDFELLLTKNQKIKIDQQANKVNNKSKPKANRPWYLLGSNKKALSK